MNEPDTDMVLKTLELYFVFHWPKGAIAKEVGLPLSTINEVIKASQDGEYKTR